MIARHPAERPREEKAQFWTWLEVEPAAVQTPPVFASLPEAFPKSELWPSSHLNVDSAAVVSTMPLPTLLTTVVRSSPQMTDVRIPVGNEHAPLPMSISMPLGIQTPDIVPDLFIAVSVNRAGVESTCGR